MYKVAVSVDGFMWEHVSSDLVEHMQKIEEEVHAKTEKLLKIVEDFQKKNFSKSQFMEH